MRDKKKDGAIALTDRERERETAGPAHHFLPDCCSTRESRRVLPKPVGFNSSCSLAMPAGTHGPQRYSVFCWELKWIFIFSCNKPMLMGLLLEKQFLNFICLLQQNAPLLRAWPCALLFTSIYFGYLDSHWKITNQHWPKSLLSFLDFTCTHLHRCESKLSRCVSAWCTLTSFPPGGVLG